MHKAGQARGICAPPYRTPYRLPHDPVLPAVLPPVLPPVPQLHDLRRLVAPESLLNRVVFSSARPRSTRAAPNTHTTGREEDRQQGPNHLGAAGSSWGGGDRASVPAAGGPSLAAPTPSGVSLAAALAAARGIDREGAVFGDALISAMERAGQALGPPPAPPPHIITHTPGLTSPINPLARAPSPFSPSPGFPSSGNSSGWGAGGNLGVNAVGAGRAGQLGARQGAQGQGGSGGRGLKGAEVGAGRPPLPPLCFESAFEGGNLRAAVQVCGGVG